MATTQATARHLDVVSSPTRSAFSSSLVALQALILRDLVVLRKHFGEFVVRTLVQPFLLCFVFLFVFPKIGQQVGGGGGHGAQSFATVLVPGVVGISIMFQGVQSVALQMSAEFGYTREIEDRVQAPCPIWLVAVSKVLSGAVQGLISAAIVLPIASVVHASGVSADISLHWLVVITLVPLACIAMTALGLVLGTSFEPRNIGLMFGFVVLPITFPRRHLLPVDEACPGHARRMALAADDRARQSSDLCQRGDAGGFHQRPAHAPLRRLPSADRLLRAVPGRSGCATSAAACFPEAVPSRRIEIIESRARQQYQIATERHRLGFQQTPLAGSLRERPVGTDDAMPWRIMRIGVAQDISRQTRSARRNVAIGAHIARRDRAHPPQDRGSGVSTHRCSTLRVWTALDR